MLFEHTKDKVEEMSPTRIVLLGAGSFTFGPTSIWQILVREKLTDIELVLVDLNEEILALLKPICERLARENGLAVTVRTQTDRRTAFEGAHYIICAIDPGMMGRIRLATEIADKHLPGHKITEYGGLVGLANTLRQCQMAREVGADVKEIAPGAWLLDTANPLSRVCQAFAGEGVRTLGFCSAALESYAFLGEVFHGERPAHPWTAEQERYALTQGGLNHFSWLTSVKDRQSGEEVLPAFVEKLRENPGLLPHCHIALDLYAETGAFVLPNDAHVQDFLPPHPKVADVHGLWHGSDEKRQKRIDNFKAAGNGAPLAETFEPYTGSWEYPGTAIAALIGQREPTRFEALNLPNTGQLPGTPDGLFVETPVTLSKDGAKPHTVELPEGALAHCQRVGEQALRLVKAEREKSLTLLREAVEADPLFVDKQAGWKAVCEFLERDGLAEAYGLNATT